MTSVDPDQTVRTLLAVAGIQPSEEEIRAAVDGYPALRETLRRLHALPIDHEEQPALEFPIAPDA